MSLSSVRREFPEPERYELSEPPKYHFELNRREFVQTLGAGLIISVALPDVLGQRARGNREPSLEERLHISEDGIVTVFTSKVEVGQGSRTELTQAAAEELGLAMDRIRYLMADSKVAPNDGGTAGSRTTPSTVPAVRKGCAAARQLLLETAARKFEVQPERLSVENGSVQGLPAGKSFGYADLVRGGAELKARGSDAAVREVSEWKILGTAVPKVNAEEIVTGKHRYPSDTVRPGMLYGKIVRPVGYGATLVRADLDAAKKLGAVVVREGDFLGVAAKNSYLAEQARAAVAQSAEWKTAAHPSSKELYEHLKSHTSGRPRRDVRGNPDDLLKEGAGIHRAEYHVAYVQHAPMEPRAALAEWENGQVTVWTGTQQPQRVRDELARSFQIPAERVRVIVPDTGGGFGGKHSGECAVEAARLAKEAGKPVLLRWSREEEFTWAYFRPSGVINIAAALGSSGRISAWEHINYNSGASAIATPYQVENTATEFRGCDAPLRAGSYRALAATANTFARESMMDELAAQAQSNPLAFRLKHLSNERLRNVLMAAAEKFGWDAKWKKQSGTQRSGVGLACGTEKGSFVAACVRVEVDSNGRYRVTDVTEAFECGAILNPRNTRAQVEGAIIQGLGAALHEEMRFADGKILNPRFSEYRVPRFENVPPIETVLLDRKDLTSVGAGETPIIAIAPAIANALFHAVQVRLRSMPIRSEELIPV